MTLEELIIAAARIAGSLPVLRWALAGAILAILVDFSDTAMISLLQFGGVRDYQSFDKAVDLVYMVTFLVAALKWSGTPRTIAIALFGYRILGVAAFELYSWRGVLLLFPNVFEFWFVFVAGVKRFRPGYEMTWRRAAAWMVPLLLLKELQEYVLHWNQVLENYGTVDLVVSWWKWIVALF